MRAPLLTALLVVAPLVGAVPPRDDDARAFGLVLHYDPRAVPEGEAPFSHFTGRVAALDRIYGPLGIRFALEAALPLDAPADSPCVGPDALILRLAALPAEPGTLHVGVAAERSDSSEPVGCAYQDGAYAGMPYAALYDPPYRTLLLAGTEAQRDHHAEILYAHEVGHLLGGLHELALPPPQTGIPVSATIMHPTLQYNLPVFSGATHESGCLVEGNACRIASLAHAASAPAARLPGLAEDLPPEGWA